MSELINGYLEELQELGVGAHVAAFGVGAAGGLVARNKILKRKCMKLHANDPERLQACLAHAKKLNTASGKSYGFK